MPSDPGTVGRIVDGDGAASGFVAQVEDLLADAVGFRPFPGTLNLTGASPLERLDAERHPLPGDDHCDGLILASCRVGGVRAAVLRPLVPDYPESKTELVAPVRLRTVLDVETGDDLTVTSPSSCSPTPAVVAAASSEFDGVVFDLDGTLVDLDVDWPAVHERLESLLAAHLDGPITGYGRREVFDLAAAHGLYDELDRLVASAEVAGVPTATALPALSVLGELDCPVGVCTANAAEAARRALARFDALDAVDAIVARDTMTADKPDPATLTWVLDAMGVEPGNALYVGDEDDDVTLAVATGTSYAHVEGFSV